MANNKTNNEKLPLSVYLAEKGVTYDSGWEKVYSSNRTFYRRNENPKLLLLTEAVKLSNALDMSLDDLVKDLSSRGILIE